MARISKSKIDKDGIENIVICVGQGCFINKRSICNGNYICFSNNHKKQTCTISLGNHSNMYYKEIEKIKDEVWVESECLKYLQKKGIPINQEAACLKRSEENVNL